MASTEQDKRRRAELAQELGFYPASRDPADIDRHRRLNAALDRAPTLDRIRTGSTGNSHTCGRRSDSTRPKPVAVLRRPTCTTTTISRRDPNPTSRSGIPAYAGGL